MIAASSEGLPIKVTESYCGNIVGELLCGTPIFVVHSCPVFCLRWGWSKQGSRSGLHNQIGIPQTGSLQYSCTNFYRQPCTGSCNHICMKYSQKARRCQSVSGYTPLFTDTGNLLSSPAYRHSSKPKLLESITFFHLNIARLKALL